MAITMKRYMLDASELATVLAALRCWQRTLTTADSKPPEWDIATNDGSVEPLSADALDTDDIDMLVERLNSEDELQPRAAPGQEAAEPCDECGALIPESEPDMYSASHAESCSLHPANLK